MKKTVFGLVLLVAAASATAGGSSPSGLNTVASAFDFEETVQRFELAAVGRGLRVFTKVDHAAGGQSVDLPLRPTTVIIFGNPKIGTKLMQCGQTMGIDLPQKALVWQDEDGKVFVSYNDPSYLSDRHALGDCGGVVAKVGGALAMLAKEATEEHSDASAQKP